MKDWKHGRSMIELVRGMDGPWGITPIKLPDRTLPLNQWADHDSNQLVRIATDIVAMSLSVRRTLCFAQRPIWFGLHK
jgi:hypothetical protein